MHLWHNVNVYLDFVCFPLPLSDLICSNVTNQLTGDRDGARYQPSLGLIENPTYVEQDELDPPSYDAVSAKEKEAEV